MAEQVRFDGPISRSQAALGRRSAATSAARAARTRARLGRAITVPAGSGRTVERLEDRTLFDGTVVFNELMYNQGGANADALEYVEIHNQMAVAVDLSGWSIRDGITYNFPAGTKIAGGAYMVIASNPTTLQSTTGFAGARGPFTGGLSNGGESVGLYNNNNRLLDEVDYEDGTDGLPGWVVGPDGGGVTLAKIDPDASSTEAKNWGASTALNGTPGAANVVSTTPNLAINETGAGGAGFFVELVNRTASPIDLGGVRLAGSGGGSFTFPGGTVIQANGYLSRTAAQVGFTPAVDTKLYAFASGGAFLDAAVVTNTTRGRGVEGGARWLFPSPATPGAANTFTTSNAIVINEVMYNHALNPEVPAVSSSTTVVPMNAAWRYNQQNVPATGWQSPAYNASNAAGWLNGTGVLYSDSTVPPSAGTQLNLGRNTYYFRTTFNYSGSGTPRLNLSHYIDDGAVFYLNGVEVNRFNMPAGQVNDGTTPASSLGDAALVTTAISPAALVQGQNTFAVEVHQSSPSSGDIVMGASLAIDTGTPGIPPSENTEEWVELYNRSGSTVDLSGWKLADGIDYAIPAGTTLVAGQYLVVAKNAAALAAANPSARVIGNFGGSLSNSGETILLLDTTGNPADEVRYYDSGRWGDYADGGGSSLELRDPDSDNSRAEAWANSDESGKSAWKNFTMTGVAADGVNDPQQWNEFVVGLLGKGEFLIDDVSVVQTSNPGQQLIQNGTFQSGSMPTTWRVIGSHKGSVVNDPTNAAQRVMRIVSTDETDHMHNHAETTLAGGVGIQTGQTYTISFRAKWVAGSNLLNTRLWLNRLGETWVLPTPTNNGTPGAQNSRFVANAGPTFGTVQHGPVTPTAVQAVTVSATANDPDGVASVQLSYRVNDGAKVDVLMTAAGGGKYNGAIPAQAAGAVVQFWVTATDNLGATAAFPAAGAAARALYKVGDGSTPNPEVHDLRIIMTPADTEFLHRSTNVMSNDPMPATVIYDDRLVYYNVGVRLKSSERGRDDPGRVGFVVTFSPDQPFRGVHDKISIDRSGTGNNEVVSRQIIQGAGGVAAGSYDDLVNVFAPRSAQNGVAILNLGGYSNEFLDTQFTDGGDGLLYDWDLIYYPQSTTGGAEGLKLPQPDGVSEADLQDLGDDEDRYRWRFTPSNNRDVDDFATLIQMNKLFSISDNAEFDARSKQLLDVDEWLRYFALHQLMGDADSYGSGYAHNLNFYVRPSDGKVLALPHDLDYNFQSNLSIIPSQGAGRLVSLPGNLHAYFGHVKDVLDATYNPTYAAALTGSTIGTSIAGSTYVGSYADLAGQDYGNVQSYIANRYNAARSEILSAVPTVAFAITTNNGQNFSTDESSVTLEGNGWVDVRTIRLAGKTVPLDVTWTDKDSWRAVIPLAQGANALTLQAFDPKGLQVGTDSITVTTTGGFLSPAGNLRVTELYYNPSAATSAEISAGFADADEFEFMELTNVAPGPISLEGVTFSSGIEYAFPAGSTLGTGERIVLARNADAFARRNPGVAVAGVYSGKIANEGERLATTIGVGGASVFDFTYDDVWYPTTNGQGYSLVIVDPNAAAGQWSLAAGWKAGGTVGGTPGTVESVAPASVASVVYNDGAAQRSRVRDITVTFDRPVVLDAGAFTLVRTGGAPALTVPVTATPVGTAGLSFVLTFGGDHVQSLLDGIYTLTVLGAKVHTGTATGPAMAANFTTKFHRLFADSDGDGDVDAADLFQLRSTVNKVSPDPAYKWYFDYDAGGVVDAADLFQIRSRVTITYKGY